MSAGVKLGPRNGRNSRFHSVVAGEAGSHVLWVKILHFVSTPLRLATLDPQPISSRPIFVIENDLQRQRTLAEIEGFRKGKR